MRLLQSSTYAGGQDSPHQQRGHVVNQSRLLRVRLQGSGGSGTLRRGCIDEWCSLNVRNRCAITGRPARPAADDVTVATATAATMTHMGIRGDKPRQPPHRQSCCPCTKGPPARPSTFAHATRNLDKLCHCRRATLAFHLLSPCGGTAPVHRAGILTPFTPRPPRRTET